MFLVPGQLLPTVHDLSEPSLTLPASTLFGEQELNLLTELHLFTAAQIAQLSVTFVFTLPPFLGALVCCGGRGEGGGGFSWVPPAISPGLAPPLSFSQTLYLFLNCLQSSQ